MMNKATDTNKNKEKETIALHVREESLDSGSGHDKRG